MEVTKNNKQIAPLSNVSLSLQRRDSKGIVRYVTKLTPTKIAVARKEFDAKVQELEGHRNSFQFFYDEYDGEHREKYLETIRDRISQTEAALQQLAYMPFIGQLANDDYDKTVDAIEFLLLDTLEYFDVPKETVVGRSAELATEIVEMYKSLTLEDIALCFRMARDGEYGELYNRLDGTVVKRWLKTYWTNAQQMAVERNESVHMATKEVGAQRDGFLLEIGGKLSASMNHLNKAKENLKNG